MRKCSRWLSQIVAVGLAGAPIMGHAQDAATLELPAEEAETEESVSAPA